MANLQAAIADANRRVGIERQQTYARKAYLKQSDGQLLETLCGRAEELLAMLASGGNVQASAQLLTTAVRIARKQQELRR